MLVKQDLRSTVRSQQRHLLKNMDGIMWWVLFFLIDNGIMVAWKIRMLYLGLLLQNYLEWLKQGLNGTFLALGFYIFLTL